eukprot:2138083-Heterocapsa_arctica.AAC.1
MVEVPTSGSTYMAMLTHKEVRSFPRMTSWPAGTRAEHRLLFDLLVDNPVQGGEAKYAERGFSNSYRA